MTSGRAHNTWAVSCCRRCASASATLRQNAPQKQVGSDNSSVSTSTAIPYASKLGDVRSSSRPRSERKRPDQGLARHRLCGPFNLPPGRPMARDSLHCPRAAETGLHSGRPDRDRPSPRAGALQAAGKDGRGPVRAAKARIRSGLATVRSAHCRTVRDSAEGYTEARSLHLRDSNFERRSVV